MEAPVQKAPWPWYIRFIAGKNPVFTLARALIWALILIVLFKFVLVGIRVRGQSMEPTFHEGQVKFINRLAYLKNPPKRGDVVAVRAPGLRAVFLKRVVALPGEQVSIQNGIVYINGGRLDEPYIKGITSNIRSFVLEPAQYWVIGDNRTVTEQWKKFDYQILGKLLY